jgi:uncharacterized delta-60 repeat protein
MKKLLVLFFTVFTATLSYSQMAGTLDTSFSGNGTAIYTLPATTSAYGLRIVEQPDGKLLVAGAADSSYAIMRIKNDSTLDAGFGINGLKKASIPGYTYSNINSMHLVPGGNIILALLGMPAQGGTAAHVYTRLNSSGAADVSFGTGGSIEHTASADTIGLNAIFPLPGNKYVILESFSDFMTQSERTKLIGILTNGATDNSYGIAGVADVPGFRCDGATQLPNGKVVMFGYDAFFGNNFKLMCFKTNGTPDSGFGVNGVKLEPIMPASNINGVFSDSTGNIYTSVGYGFPATPRITKYDSTGTKVVAFGTSGYKDLATGINIGPLAFYGNGKILAGGKSSAGDNLVMRWLPNGSADAGFGTTGSSTFPSGGISSMLISSTGKIYTVSNAQPGTALVVSRLHGNGTSSVISQNSDDDLLIYPNPSASIVHIKSGANINIVVRDIQGRTLLTSRETSFDISNLASGLYMIQLSDKEGNVLKTEKLLKAP